MLLTKEKIAEDLKNECLKTIGSKDLFTHRLNQLNEKFNIPAEHSSDLLTLRSDFINESDFLLYCYTSVLMPSKIVKWFTEAEQKRYSESRYKITKVKFPIRINAISVDGDQFIGKISTSDLIKFRDAQLIYYNEATQRRLVHYVNGDTEYYSIDVDQKAVSEIMKLMQSGMYIADPITINLPEESLYDYDEYEKVLTIREADHFDIIDGYHRYLAISNIYNLDKKFEYNMEIRIVCFSEQKAQQFIYQTNQQTKLKKIDSDSMNQTKLANQVVSKLNTDGSCNLVGQISRNKGIIDSSVFAYLIDSLLFKGISKKEERVKLIKVSGELKAAINVVTENDYSLLQKKWKNDYIALFVVLVSCGESDIVSAINEYYPLVKELKIGKTILPVDIKRIRNIINREEA